MNTYELQDIQSKTTTETFTRFSSVTRLQIGRLV